MCFVFSFCLILIYFMLQICKSYFPLLQTRGGLFNICLNSQLLFRNINKTKLYPGASNFTDLFVCCVWRLQPNIFHGINPDGRSLLVLSMERVDYVEGFLVKLFSYRVSLSGFTLKGFWLMDRV